MGADDISLWPFAVKHAVWLYNHVPNFESGLTPMELLTKQKADHRDILRSHVWGWLSFVRARTQATKWTEASKVELSV